MLRREFLTQSLGASAIALLSNPTNLFGFCLEDVPIRAITQGPKSHWFGYYDKWQLDLSGRYVLGMEVDVPRRSPTENDIIKIGVVDLDSRSEERRVGKEGRTRWSQYH